MTEQENKNVFDLMVSTKSAVKDLEIPSADEVNAIMTNLMSWIAIDLDNRNIAGAVHKMSIAEAYETYWKRLVKAQPGLIIHKNTVAAHRYMGLYDFGAWLEPKMAKSKRKPNKPIDAQYEDLIWQDDLNDWGVTKGIRQMAGYLYKYGEGGDKSRNDVRDYLFSYTRRNGDDKLPDDLNWNVVLKEIKPGTAKTHPTFYEIPSQIETSEGRAFYKWMRLGKSIVIKYVNRIKQGDVSIAEIMVLTRLPFWGNIFTVWQELKKLTESSDGS